jgi:hypothetical protein
MEEMFPFAVDPPYERDAILVTHEQWRMREQSTV